MANTLNGASADDLAASIKQWVEAEKQKLKARGLTDEQAAEAIARSLNTVGDHMREMPMR